MMQRKWVFCIHDVKAALSVAARLKLKLRLGVFAHVGQSWSSSVNQHYYIMFRQKLHPWPKTLSASLTT